MHLKVQNETKCLRRDITPTILLIFTAICLRDISRANGCQSKHLST